MTRASQIVRVPVVRYNGRGERVTSQYPLILQDTSYVYDEAGHHLGKYLGSSKNNQGEEVIYLDDLPVAITINAVLSYLETDHLGTPRIAANPATNAQQWKWDFFADAFGGNAPVVAPSGGIDVKLRYPGQYADSYGVNYNYFRDYEPGTGRYLESDPIGLFGGLSTYGYAFQEPLNFSDPLGLVSDAQCCRGAQAQVLAETANARGFVACCGGKRVSCTIDDPYDSDAAANAKRSCRLKHEDSHNADTTRCLCQGDGQPTGAAPSPPGSGPNNPNQYGSECDAYSVSLPCFIDKLKGCQQSRDAGCVNSLKAELVNQRNQYQKFCGRKPPV